MAGMFYLAKGPNILRSGTAKKKTAAHTIMITSCHGRPGLVWVILCPSVEFQYFKRITVTILLRCARNTCDDDIIAWVHRPTSHGDDSRHQKNTYGTYGIGIGSFGMVPFLTLRQSNMAMFFPPIYRCFSHLTLHSPRISQPRFIRGKTSYTILMKSH